MAFQKNNDSQLIGLIKDLETIIELAHQQNDSSFKDMIDKAISTKNNFESRCYKINNCMEENCPAYKNESGRCWLIAGTMCGGSPQGKFVEKYGLCTKCDVFQSAVGNDPVHGLRELVIILIHSLEIKHAALKEALANVKTLKGLLPVCSTCKKIRADDGSWHSMDFFIDTHSEAQVSHGMCPECAREQFPEYYQRVIDKKIIKKQNKD